MAANSLKSCSEDRTMRSIGSLLLTAVFVFSLWPESLDSLARNRAAASPRDYDTHGRLRTHVGRLDPNASVIAGIRRRRRGDCIRVARSDRRALGQQSPFTDVADSDDRASSDQRIRQLATGNVCRLCRTVVHFLSTTCAGAWPETRSSVDRHLDRRHRRQNPRYLGGGRRSSLGVRPGIHDGR